jgi:histidine triad (HIT) family protein
MAQEYDAENIFAKIIDGKVPAFKVFESRSAIAFLDAFPAVEGHTLFVPKAKGFTDFLAMPPAKASEFMRDLQKVAAAVKKATGATAVNILQNNGADAGQTVFHPHFHIIPRKKDDNLLKPPASAKEMIKAEAAEPMVAEIMKALNPPKPLKKASFGKVSSIKPDVKGLNLQVKILEELKEVESKGGKFYEALCGDSSGTIVVSLRDSQKEGVAKDAVFVVRNASVKMVRAASGTSGVAGHIRLCVDKWGKIELSSDPFEGDVDKDPAKNISSTEYELVPQS